MSGLVTTTWPAVRIVRPDRRRRVAVVDAGADVHLGGCGQLAKRRELVLAERLGREEVERARGGILRHRLEHRQVVAERLARRGGRDDDDVLAVAQRLERLRLVACTAISMPWLRSARTRRGSSHAGKGTVTASRAGSTRCVDHGRLNRRIGEQSLQRLDR